MFTRSPELLSLENENGASVFMQLAYNGLMEVFEEAKEVKPDFTFYEAIVSGNKRRVIEYLKEHDLINSFSKDGFAPIALAVFFNQTELAKLLLSKGGDPNLNATNPSKVNALHAAVARGNIELCKLFLEQGANPNALQAQSVAPLHSAVHRNDLGMVKLLIKHGAQQDLKMDNGDTALIIAEREGHDQVINYFQQIRQNE
jgi:ankyrin repeat protein